jgi:hypothetical protein
MGEMTFSEQMNEIGSALAIAQSTMTGAYKASHEADIKGRDGKPGYAYTYANLADALIACRETLNINGIAVLQSAGDGARGVEIVTLLVHKSGQWAKSSALTMPVGTNNAQAVGSAITYARRYQLLGMVGLAPEDDDGSEATQHPPAPPTPREPAAAKLGPRIGKSKKGEALVKAIHDLMAAAIKASADAPLGVWLGVLKNAAVDVPAYEREDGRAPADEKALTFKDAIAVKAELERKPPAPITAAAVGAAYRRLCASSPDYKPENWKREWADMASIAEWPDSPAPELLAFVLAKINEIQEKIDHE